MEGTGGALCQYHCCHLQVKLYYNLEKTLSKVTLVLGRPGGFLRSLRNYSRAAGKYLPETRLQQTAELLLHALTGSCLLGFDGLSAATQCYTLSGNHRVTLIRYFFIPLLVPRQRHGRLP